MLYPHIPSAKTEGTSEQAAKEMRGKGSYLQKKVLELLKQHNHTGLTTDEAAGWLEQTVLAIRPRFSELRALGLIVKTGKTRENLSGKKASVWALTEPQTKLL